MNVIDIGAFPVVNMSFLWLTIGIPAALVILIWVILGFVKFKDEGTAGTLGFFAFFFGFLLALFVSGSVNSDLQDARHERILEAVIEVGGFETVVDLDSEEADIAVIDTDGTGTVYDFIELPGDHVGLLDVTEKVK